MIVEGEIRRYVGVNDFEQIFCVETRCVCKILKLVKVIDYIIP